jgi:uncharacterized protein
MIKYGKVRLQLTLQPVSGKALPVRRGEVLRIRQTLGEQCVDLNAFNIDDYKEYMDVSACRPIHGFRPKKCDIIFSNPPRFRPMIGILEMSDDCVTDILAKSCHGTLFEAAHGFNKHTSCQDTIAEAIAEYALTADDVHHSFNLWMDAEWDSAGRYKVVRNSAKAGDFVDLLACFDQLMVPAICGAGDTFLTSNFSFKPIEVEVFTRSEATEALVDKIAARSGRFHNQRTVDQFRVKNIKASRKLRPVPNFQPAFVNYPIKVDDIDVELSNAEMAAVEGLITQGFGRDAADVIRKGFFLWHNNRRPRDNGWARIQPEWL